MNDSNFIAFANARAQVESDLVGCVLSDPSRAVAIAEAAGVSPMLFSHLDLRLIYCAADIARHRPLAEILQLARRALLTEHYWDDEMMAGLICGAQWPSRWSNVLLSALANSWPFCVPVIRFNALRLVDFDRRQRRIERLRRAMVKAIRGKLTPKQLAAADAARTAA